MGGVTNGIKIRHWVYSGLSLIKLFTCSYTNEHDASWWCEKEIVVLDLDLTSLWDRVFRFLLVPDMPIVGLPPPPEKHNMCPVVRYHFFYMLCLNPGT